MAGCASRFTSRGGVTLGTMVGCGLGHIRLCWLSQHRITSTGTSVHFIGSWSRSFCVSNMPCPSRFLQICDLTNRVTTRHARLPEGPSLGPRRTDCVDGRIVEGQLALGIMRHGQTLPRHPGVAHPEDEVKHPGGAHLAFWTALGHREVRRETCLARGCSEVARNRRRCRRW